jgi:ATP-dependent Clp protease ATP-binding subunit ClpA
MLGARQMARFIQEQITRPLAEELLFGKLSKGGHVTISVHDNQLKFAIEEYEGNNVPN